MPYKHARAGARWSTIEEPKDALKVMGGEEATAKDIVIIGESCSASKESQRCVVSNLVQS